MQAIFDGGRIRGKIAETKAREDELLGAYRAAVIAAFSDVENALGNVTHLAAQQTALPATAASTFIKLSRYRHRAVTGLRDIPRG